MVDSSTLDVYEIVTICVLQEVGARIAARNAWAKTGRGLGSSRRRRNVYTISQIKTKQKE